MRDVGFVAPSRRWRARFMALVALGAGLLSTLSLRAALGADVEFDGAFPRTSKTRIFPLGRIQRGDKGVGYTVMAEDRLTRFDVEVLGLLEGMLGPKRHVILARLSGPEIEYTGVISGMSGSPVYIDGQLVGAVSYRFGLFSKEPIAGITPIEYMLEVYGSAGDPPPSQLGAALLPSGNQAPRTIAGRPVGVAVSDFREREGLPAITLPRRTPPLGPYDPRPIETPVTISGLHPSVAEELRRQLEDAGLVVASGGGDGRIAARDAGSGLRRIARNEPSKAGGVRAAPIAPGAPIAAVLMRGDIYVAATGTVTLVDGSEVLAFGHPFLGYGHVVFPMATASILHTLATPLGSHKQGAPALEVGSITHDRLAAIAGRIGGVAPMVPVRVRVERLSPPSEELRWSETQVEVVKDTVWLPVLVEKAIASSAAGRIDYEAGGTIDMDVSVHVNDRTLRIVDTYSAEAPMRVSAFVARDVGNVVGLIARTSLEPKDVRGIDASLRVKPEVAFAAIERAVPDRNVLRAGEKLGLSLRIRPYRRDPVLVRVLVDVPRDARGDVDVFVGGGIEMDRREGEVFGERFPRDLDELLGILAERRPARAIFARVFMPRPGMRADADLFSSLPPSQRATLSGDHGRVIRAATEAMGPVTSMPFGEVVIGSVSVPIHVVRER